MQKAIFIHPDEDRLKSAGYRERNRFMMRPPERLLNPEEDGLL
jgi:hypothetical protein